MNFKFINESYFPTKIGDGFLLIKNPSFKKKI